MTRSSIKVRTHNEQATQSGGFFVRWLGHWCAERSSAHRRCSGIRFAYPRAERVELARKRQAVGIFAQRANTLVPAKRRRIRFAFAALFVGAFCERPRANAVRPYGQAQSVRITVGNEVTLVP